MLNFNTNFQDLFIGHNNTSIFTKFLSIFCATRNIFKNKYLQHHIVDILKTTTWLHVDAFLKTLPKALFFIFQETRKLNHLIAV